MNLLLLLFSPIIKSLDNINRKLDILMAQVGIEQSTLDEIAETVSDVADDLQAILDSDTPTPPADETALRAAVEKLQAVGPKVEETEDQPHPDQTLPGDLTE